ncbi:MAG: type II toxin-antitoxin system MqsA family antitoxin [Sulfuricaulis sp.]|nr:type II toxin-antitoxin system MqsA family antitoxin [Sulfuricaulis sp.]
MQDTNKLICPACEIGTLHEELGPKEYAYEGQPFIVQTSYSTCPECGTEVVTPEQARINDRLIREKHKRIDGLLSAEEIKQLRLKFDLSQYDASFLFGGGLNAFSKYERLEVAQSVAMDRLMRIVDIVPGAFNALVHIANRAAPAVVNVTKSVQRITVAYSNDNLTEIISSHPRHKSGVNLRVVKKDPSSQTYQEFEQYRKVAE